MTRLQILYSRIKAFEEGLIDFSSNPFERCAANRVARAKTILPHNLDGAEILLDEATFYINKAITHEEERAEIHYLRTNR